MAEYINRSNTAVDNNIYAQVFVCNTRSVYFK